MSGCYACLESFYSHSFIRRCYFPSEIVFFIMLFLGGFGFFFWPTYDAGSFLETGGCWIFAVYVIFMIALLAFIIAGNTVNGRVIGTETRTARPTEASPLVVREEVIVIRYSV